MNPVQLALASARLKLSFLHGLRVTDLMNNDYSWNIDTNEEVMLIDRAISSLDTSADNNSCP